MSAPAAAPVDVAELRRQANEQGEVVKALKRELKDNSAAKDDPRLKEALAKLMQIKTALDAAILGNPEEIARLQAAKRAKEAEMAWRATLEAVIAQRGFFFRSNEIHPNAPSGFYDFGPNGCAVKQNLLQLWRNWFVLHESMLEIECPTMTPESVFITSGHVSRFTDFMVTCEKEDMSYRADKLLEEWCEKRLADDKAPLKPEERAEIEKVERDAGAMNAEQLKTWFHKYGLKSPEGNDLSDPFPFNLMFKSQIGPSGKVVGYLRPETAQGMFVNFKRLLEINSGKMPFAAAQIGTANRNEIAPRQGLLRVREFTLAEIEHFVHPDDKRHANFADIAALPLLLLPRAAQEKGQMAAQKIVAATAVSDKIINNETLAYFMARTQLFLLACGIKEEKLRFRQHKATEMAHYASDCLTESDQLLTSEGFMFLHEIEAFLAAEGVTSLTDLTASKLLVASYNPETEQLEYRPATRVVVKAAEERTMVEFTSTAEALRWDGQSDEYGRSPTQVSSMAEVSAASSARTAHARHAQSAPSNGLSVVVTPGHDMYVMEGTRVTTGSKVDWDGRQLKQADGKKRRVHDGYHVRKARDLKHQSKARRCVKFLAKAAQGVLPQEGPLPFVAPLGLHSASQVEAFLELYGFWLGDGTLRLERGDRWPRFVGFNQKKAADVAFLREKLHAVGLVEETDWRVYEISDGTKSFCVTAEAWCDYFIAEYGKKYSTAKGVGPKEVSTKSAKWFWWWVLKRLGRAQLRLVLAGLRRADGAEATGESAIFTSSTRFRDEVVRAALHAGYAARFKLEYGEGSHRGYAANSRGAAAAEGVVARSDNWRVTYPEEYGYAAPVVGPEEVREVQYHGRVWCVTVPPHALIVVRRASANADGVVTKASTPVIVGNCWDAEILTTYGWIECVGHADRAAYDLDVHSKATGADLTAQETFAQPRAVEVAKFDIKNATVGKTFGKRAKEVTETVRAMDTKAALELEATLAAKGSASLSLPSGGDPVTLTREMLSVSVKSELQHTAKYTPHVIEPAFGIGRIFYAMLEHTFYTRPAAAAAAPAVAASSASSKADAAAAAAADKRAVFALPAFLSPHKLSILPLSSNADFLPYQSALKKDCIQLSLTNKVDDSSGSIGKRYSRADEIGIPFGCTIDFQTKEDQTVTIRERDSMQQIRVAIKEAVPLVARLCQGQITWAQAYEQFPKFNAPQE